MDVAHSFLDEELDELRLEGGLGGFDGPLLAFFLADFAQGEHGARSVGENAVDGVVAGEVLQG